MGKFTVFNSASHTQAALKTPASGSRIFRLYKIWDGKCTKILTGIADKPVELSVSTTWGDAGGGFLAKAIQQFSDNLLVRVAAGSSYEAFVPSGKWTQQRATGAQTISVSVDVNLFSKDIPIAGPGAESITNYSDVLIGQDLFDSLLPQEMSLNAALNNAKSAAGKLKGGVGEKLKGLKQLENADGDASNKDFASAVQGVASLADDVVKNAAMLRGVPTFTFDYGNIFKHDINALQDNADWALMDITLKPSQNFVLDGDVPKPLYITLSMKFETVCQVSLGTLDKMTY